jgi:hypothetical protein
MAITKSNSEHPTFAEGGFLAAKISATERKSHQTKKILTA